MFQSSKKIPLSTLQAHKLLLNMLKVRQTSSINFWQGNGIMLCLCKHTSIVKWLDQDNFTCNNYWKHPLQSSLPDATFSPKTWELSKIPCVIPVDRLRNSMSTDHLVDLAINVVRVPIFLISKLSICNAYMSTYPWRKTASSLFVDAQFLYICLFCKENLF